MTMCSTLDWYLEDGRVGEDKNVKQQASTKPLAFKPILIDCSSPLTPHGACIPNANPSHKCHVEQVELDQDSTALHLLSEEVCDVGQNLYYSHA